MRATFLQKKISRKKYRISQSRSHSLFPGVCIFYFTKKIEK